MFIQSPLANAYGSEPILGIPRESPNSAHSLSYLAAVPFAFLIEYFFLLVSIFLIIAFVTSMLAALARLSPKQNTSASSPQLISGIESQILWIPAKTLTATNRAPNMRFPN